MRSSRRLVAPVLLALLAFVVATFAFALPSSAAVKDTDKDGLPDAWEKKGGKVPGGLDIYRLGARTNHKDVFVELNFTAATSSKKVSCAGLDALYTAFAKAPVTNQDGKKGVRLHLDAGKKCPSRSYDLKGSGKISAKGASSADGYIHPSSYGLASNRKKVFRNGIVAEDSRLSGAEGEADFDNFVVKRRTGGTDWSFVALHELGHNFGLDHSAYNSFSVMGPGAYSYASNGGGTQILDYTRYPVEALDETALDEQSGYRTGSAAGDAYLRTLFAPQFCGAGLSHQYRAALSPVDWDCSETLVVPANRTFSSTPVQYDVNHDGAIGTVPAVAAQWPSVLTHLGNGSVGG